LAIAQLRVALAARSRAHGRPPTEEYVTITDLTMAADSARIVLRERVVLAHISASTVRWLRTRVLP